MNEPMGKINDTKLLRLVDSGVSQAEAAREMGVSRQAVSKRLRELRGRHTRVVVAKKAEELVESGFNAMEQLQEINRRALALLEQAEENPELSLKCIAEVRNQIKLAADIQLQLYSAQEAQRFMEIVRDALRETTPEAYARFKKRIEDERSLGGVVRFS